MKSGDEAVAHRVGRRSVLGHTILESDFDSEVEVFEVESGENLGLLRRGARLEKLDDRSGLGRRGLENATVCAASATGQLDELVGSGKIVGSLDQCSMTCYDSGLLRGFDGSNG